MIKNKLLTAVLTAVMIAGAMMPAYAAKKNDNKGPVLSDIAVAGVAMSMSEYNDANKDNDTTAEEVIDKIVNPSPYENIAITRVTNYVNIRKKPNTKAKVLGKIYDKAAATILKTVNGEDGEWYYIQSGSVKGYMKAEYFVTGEEAEKIAKEVGNVLCKTTAVTLRLHKNPRLNSRTTMLLAEDSIYSVLEESVVNKKGDEFIKVLVAEGEGNDKDITGYISADYADVYVEFAKAISREEELAEIRRQEELRKAEEAARAAAAAAAAQAQSSGSSSSGSSSSGSSSSGGGYYSGGGSGTGSAIAASAQRYVGLRYVWGGTSLSSGADCSGFTMSIYSKYGISLPHSSSAQAYSGRSISSSELRAGDLAGARAGVEKIQPYQKEIVELIKSYC